MVAAGPDLGSDEFGAEQSTSQCFEPSNVATRKESSRATVLVSGRRGTQQAGVIEKLAECESRFVSRRHEHHVVTEHITDDTRQERVVRAPEEKCIDLGLANGREESLGQQSDLLTRRAAALHEFDESRTRCTREFDGGAVRGASHGEFVGTRIDGADRADDAHRTRPCGAHESL